jgi:hypothetical protein
MVLRRFARGSVPIPTVIPAKAGIQEARTMDSLTRRDFVRSSLAGAVALGLEGQRCLASETNGGARRKSCILLRMEGGPSQIDTFDPKPGTRNGGEFGAIETSLPGVRVCEHLPRMAEQMQYLTLIRSMVSSEGNHQRAQDLLQTGFSTAAPRSAGLDQGASEFAERCLQARRLVESGKPFVEVALGGWDTHRDNFTRTRALCEVLDPAFATLIRALKARGLWESTLVVWMGEFGRKPQVNKQDGRDHWTRGWSVVLGGCGIPEGHVIGRTSEDGMEVVENPVTVPGLFRAIRTALDAGGESIAAWS